MSVYNKINSVLEKVFGITVVKSKVPRKKNTSIGDNLYVEFLGIAGVGKSTICRYFLKNSNINFKNKPLTNSVLEAFRKGTNLNLEGFYDDMYKSKLRRSVGLNRTGETLFSLINYYRSLLLRDLALQNYFNNQIAFVDEGIFQSYAPEILSISHDEIQKQFKSNRVIIFCDATSEYVNNNLQKRRKTGKLKGHHQNMNPATLNKFIEDGLKRERVKVHKLEELGIPILHLCLVENLEINSQLINDFLKEEIGKRNL